MEWIYGEVTSNEPYAQSRIVYLPFLNNPPSDYDTIYTVLSLAVERISNKKRKTAFVTFDQPLYWKAKEILHSTDNPEFKNLVIRLGGFHLAMSFLGSIGMIMDGSGLKELISQIYAPASVDKMLGGHAYSRAVRAHTLVHCTFVQKILSLTNFTDDDTFEIRTLLQNPETIRENIEGNVALNNLKSRFMETVKRLSEQNKTTKLWIQYLHMVSFLKMFIEAEKSGNWQLHLQTVQKMLPFFHSSGHFLYAKSAHLYLQDMYNLQERMDKDEFAEFSNGGFTIRRTDKFWSGIWSDMTIEQALMRTMKDIGGPTRGRGMSDSVLAKWVLTTPALVELTDSLTDFCNVYLTTTEQHVDSRVTRIARDIADMEKLKSWFEDHNPFSDTDGIISLSTGLKGAKNDKINCHEVLEVGLRCLNVMWKENEDGTLKTFNDIKYKRKNKVTPLKALTSTIQLSDKTVTIDPSLLFQRISI